MNLPPLVCVATADASSFIVKKGDWRNERPIAALAEMIGLYRRLRDRLDGKYAEFYAQPVQALEALSMKCGIPPPPEPKKVKNK